MADLVDFALDGQAIEGLQPQAGKQLDARFERLIGIAEGADFLRFRPLHCSRVRHAPMGGHRVPRPHRADLTGGLVADSEHEIHHRRAGFGEFVPAFTAQPARLEMRLFDEIERQRVNRPFWESAGAVPPKSSFPQCSSSASAMMLRAELPVQRNRSLYIPPSVIFRPAGHGLRASTMAETM